MIAALNLAEKFSKITDYWSPKIVAELNGQYVKLVKAKGELVWHHHEDEDELFHILKGTFIMDFRDKTTYTKAGEILVVPKGVAHRPRTGDEEVWLLLFEPKNTKHTGDVIVTQTVLEQAWI